MTPPEQTSKILISSPISSDSSLSSLNSNEDNNEPELELPKITPEDPHNSSQGRKRDSIRARGSFNADKRKRTRENAVDGEESEDIERRFRPVKKSRVLKSTTTTFKKDGLKTKRTAIYEAVDEEELPALAALEKANAILTPKKPQNGKKGAKSVHVEEDETIEGGETSTKVKRPRQSRQDKDAAAMPLASRTTGLQMFVGAHVSGAKGVHNAITNASHIGGNAFALFLKSQRKWQNPPLQADQATLFHAHCKEHEYDAQKHVVPHGSYLVNLAQTDPEKAQQAYASFLDDLRRCESLGIKLYNFHPGNTLSKPRAEAIACIANALNRAHKATKTVKPLLENMAADNNTIGGTFEDLRDIIELVEDKSRIGVCIDTCHTFAAGYDLQTPAAFRKTLAHFDEVVGIKYLGALHLNDSKAPFGSHRDLHQNIGLGFLGLRAFHNVMNEARFEGLPMVLETPIEVKNAEGKNVEDKGIWAREIKLLESLIGMDAEGQEFQVLEAQLAEKGAEERAKFQEQYDRKMVKEKKKGARTKAAGKKGGRKGKVDVESEESSNGR